MSAYHLTDEQLERAQSWLERSRVWMAEHPDADAYPCDCAECTTYRDGPLTLPWVES